MPPPVYKKYYLIKDIPYFKQYVSVIHPIKEFTMYMQTRV